MHEASEKLTVMNGLDLTGSAIKELTKVRKEQLSVKLHILLDICFLCKLCTDQSADKHWKKLTDVKHHLSTHHGIKTDKKSKTSKRLKKRSSCVTDGEHCSKTSENASVNELNVDEVKPGEIYSNDNVKSEMLNISSSWNNGMNLDSSDAEDTAIDALLPWEQQPATDLLEEKTPCIAESVSNPDTSEIKKPREKRKWAFSEKEDSLKEELNPICDDQSLLEEVVSDGCGTKSKSRKLRKCELVSKLSTSKEGSGLSYLTRAKTCPQCDLVLNTIESCWQHYVDTHCAAASKVKDAIPLIKELYLSGMKMVACPLCLKETRGSCLLKHVILVHLWRPKLKNIRRKRDMLCPVCGKAFHYEQNYYLHLRSVHGGIKAKSHSKYVAKEYTCSQCAYMTCETRRLNSHMKYAHAGIKAYSCKYCSYATWERTSLRDHLFRHADNKPYHCEKCPYQCIQKKQLRAHLLNRHGITLPKTGHTRVPPRISARQLTDSAVEMTDRETSTDPPIKRSKPKLGKLKDAKKRSANNAVATEQSFMPQMYPTETHAGVSYAYDESQRSTTNFHSQIVNNDQEKQLLHYSVQGNIIAQVTPPKNTMSQISTNDEQVICTFTLSPPGESEQHLMLPPGEQVQQLILPPGGQLVTPESSHILPSDLAQSSQTVIEPQSAICLAPNLQDKTAYQVIQIQPDVAQLSAVPPGQILDGAGKLTKAIAVTPIYAQNPQAGNNLALSGLSQVNHEGLASQRSFVYVLR